MASSTTMETNSKLDFPTSAVCKQKMYEHWQKNAPKIMFGEHQLSIEINEIGDFFDQKAKEELRETPEVVAQGFKELKEFIAGNKSLIVPKMYFSSVFSAKSPLIRLRDQA